jgi:signal transduction histidine kinase
MMTLFLVAITLALASPLRAEALRHVLVLYPYGGSLTLTNVAAESMRRALIGDSAMPIVLHPFYLSPPMPTTGDFVRNAEALRKRNDETPFDAVVALNTDALRFAVDYRDVFAPKAPVVYCCVNQAILDTMSPLPPQVTGVSMVYDIGRTLDLALALQPKTKHAFLISGASEIDLGWLSAYREQLARHAKTLDIQYLVGLTYEEMATRLARLPPESVILGGTLFADRNGRAMIPSEIGTALSAVANAPIYAPTEPYLGQGTVGGYMGTFDTAGMETAAILLKVLAGTPPADLPAHTMAALGYWVDARTLERWGIPEGRLPAGTSLLFHTPTLWEKYRLAVFLTLAVILLQSLLILALVIQTARRQRAETSARASLADLARVTRRTTMGEMTASIAHEVNQPLAAIVANANAGLRWLNRPEPNMGEAVQALERISRDGQRAGEVISTVRGMFGSRDEQHRALNLARLVRDVLTLTEGEASAHQVVLRADLPTDLPQVMADRVQLQQVVLNLVMNAIEAMQSMPVARRRLTLSLSQEAGTLVLLIADTGPGIPADRVAQVFQPFVSGKPGGMGMGLAICRSVIAAHDGSLVIERTGPEGTTFRVVLPAAVDGEDRTAPAGTDGHHRHPAK